MRILFFILIFSASCVNAQPLKREMRGAWLTTFSNIDWPDRKQNPQQQREALTAILNHYQSIGINTVFMQVRSQCDALYNSSIEPWSADLTGVQGLPPFPLWDPLQFAIDECRKRAMEIHAWMNPYRAVANTMNLPSFAPGHIAKQHPEWLLSSGTLRTLNPGLPEVREYILTIVKDVVQRYDLDGIHFDDYFYPESFVNDNATFAKYPAGFTDKGDWRRNNVNLLILSVYKEINALKPWMKFGVSPSGIYRNSTNPQIGSPTQGMQHYVTLFADSKKWLQDGWVDYLIPQVYYNSKQFSAPFPVVVDWWQKHNYGRHIYIGIASYKIGNGESGWSSGSEVPAQIKFTRRFGSIAGQSFYNTSSLLANPLGLRDSLNNLYNKQALVPNMSWKNNEKPATPEQLIISESGTSRILSWKKINTVDEFKKARYFVVYRSASGELNTDNAENILAITPDTSFHDRTAELSVNYFYGITALNRLQVESEISNIVSSAGHKMPAIYMLNSNVESNQVKLSWKDQGIDTVEFFQVERSTDGINFSVLKEIQVTNSPEEYLVNDIITTKNYYRLKAVCIDKRFSFSRIIEASPQPIDVVSSSEQTKPANEIPAKTNEVVSLKPMPAEKKLSLAIPVGIQQKGRDIVIRLNVPGNFTYYIFESGKRITWGKFRILKGGTSVKLPGTAGLLPGNFKLVLEIPGNKEEMAFEVR